MSTSSASNLRLMSDLKTMKQQPPEGVSASPLGDDNMHVWGGTVFGTDDTAWEGGIFSMRMTFPEQYPDKPPRVRFTSEMVRAAARGSGSADAACIHAHALGEGWLPAMAMPRARAA
jgi:ubiquitin-conjugating enzyme E2 A